MQERPWILVAEDNEDDALLIDRAFRVHFERVRLVRAEDGAEALALLGSATTPPNLVILDIKMPRLGGLEVLQRLEGAPYPAVIFTSSDEPTDRATAVRLGCHEYVVKPVDFEEFIEAVRGIVERHAG